MASCCVKNLLGVLQLFFALIFFCKATDNIQVVHTEDHLIPVGTPVSFKCIKQLTGAAFGWRVYLSGEEPIFGTAELNNLAPLGMEILYPDENTTILQFNATDERLTALECRFTDLRSGDIVSSNVTNIIIVVPPTRPTNVTTSLTGKQFTVNWSVPVIPEVTLTFNVTLRTASEVKIVTTNLQSHQFTISDETCGQFEVDIMVSNIAGQNRSSHKGTFTSSPGKICYEVFMENNVITLIATTKVPKCPTEGSNEYQLELRNFGNKNDHSNVTTPIPLCDASNDYVVCRVDVPSNSHFNASITSSDVSITEPVIISASNIQGASVSRDGSNSTYQVKCYFLTGSDAYGCRFMLTGIGSTNSISGTIIRDGSIGSFPVNISDIHGYSEVVAYEIDRDGMIVNDSQPFKTSNIFEEIVAQMCVSDSGSITTPIAISEPLKPSEDMTEFIAIIAGTVGGLILIIMVAMLLSIIICCIRGKRKKYINKEELKSSVPEFSSDTLYHTLAKNKDGGSRGVVDENTYSKINDNTVPIYHVLESNTPEHQLEKDSNIIIYEEVRSVNLTKKQNTGI